MFLIWSHWGHVCCVADYFLCIFRLLDMHYQMVEGRRCDIHLVLEFCDMDLKEYIRSTAQRHQTHGLPFSVLKVNSLGKCGYRRRVETMFRKLTSRQN